MMEFIIMTLSFTVGMLLASVIAFVVMFNKKVMYWYLKRVNKMVKDFENDMIDELFDEE